MRAINRSDNAEATRLMSGTMIGIGDGQRGCVRHTWNEQLAQGGDGEWRAFAFRAVTVARLGGQHDNLKQGEFYQ